MANTDKNATPLHYQAYYYTIFSLVLIGIFDTAYLAFLHYRIFTEPAYSSFCAISKAINCNTVSQSLWGIFFGLPISYYGFLGYFVLVLFLFFLRKPDEKYTCLWTLFLFLCLIFSLISIYLGYVSAVKIRAYCILCMFNYALCFTLTYLSWLLQRRTKQKSTLYNFKYSLLLISQTRLLLMFLLLTLFIFISILMFIPRYWDYHLKEPALEHLSTGVMPDSSPWIGAVEPVLTIEEFSDYQCFQCYKMHYLLRRLIAEYPNKIRLIHHHYPLDKAFNPTVVKNEFHRGSGLMALIAISAQTQGKFWEMNDLLFTIAQSKKSFSTKQLEAKINIPSAVLADALTNKIYQKKLAYDIRIGMKNRIMSTPTFIIDGKQYTGTIPNGIISKITDQ